MTRTPLGFVLSNTTEPPINLFSEDEVDAEMSAFFRQDAEDRLADRRLASSSSKQTEQPVSKTSAKLSPKWQAAKDRLERAMKRSTPQGPIEITGIVKTVAVTGLTEPSKDSKGHRAVITSLSSDLKINCPSNWTAQTSH